MTREALAAVLALVIIIVLCMVVLTPEWAAVGLAVGILAAGAEPGGKP